MAGLGIWGSRLVVNSSDHQLRDYRVRSHGRVGSRKQMTLRSQLEPSWVVELGRGSFTADLQAWWQVEEGGFC